MGSPIKHTSQAIDNWSFDETYNEASVLVVGENEAGTALERIKTNNGHLQVDVLNQLKEYQTQEVDDYTTTNVTYVCQMKSDGTWLFKKIDETGNFPTFRYANVSNNATKTTYALALTDRTTLTYGYLNTLTL